MVKLYIEDIVGRGLGIALPEWVPENPNLVDIEVDIDVAERGSDGSNRFTINVVTIDALRKRIQKDGVQFCTDTLLMDTYSYPAFIAHMNDLVEDAGERSEDWQYAVDILRNHMFWEYSGPHNDPA